MDIGNLFKGYKTAGAGGLALIVMIWLIIYLITKIQPTLEQLKNESKAHKEIIQNNTNAIKEMSNSNQNIATALALLDNSFNSVVRIMEKHDSRAENIENEVIRIRESTRRD